LRRESRPTGIGEAKGAIENLKSRYIRQTGVRLGPDPSRRPCRRSHAPQAEQRKLCQVCAIGFDPPERRRRTSIDK
jgi:hypothetical protein